MSYDLLVFEPAAVPVERAAFQAWYDAFMRWDGAWDYNDPAVCSPALQRWEAGVRRRFWALNGPHASRTGPWFRPSNSADITCAPSAIYAGFAWSRADVAQELALTLAKRHGVGFYNVSGDGSVWRPDI
ncbi:hypothetical protein [Brevundimonas diminuta]|uniref:hypothetical protein n=1 Tax=Brevundimonas diminuta TaxID=293 RepID=UPI003D9A2C5F